MQITSQAFATFKLPFLRRKERMHGMSSVKLANSAKTRITISSKLSCGNFCTAARNLAASQQQEFLGDTASQPKDHAKEEVNESSSGTKSKPQPKKLSVAEQDEQLRKKMAGIEGDGGEAGVEYEGGEPVAMKRSVKNNMFRYI